MKLPLAALAALIFPLAAQAQEENARFRYLGIADNFAVMATAPEGPEDARKVTLIVVNREESGPGGADGLWSGIIADCPAGANQMEWVVLYRGDKELRRIRSLTEKNSPHPDTPYALVHALACKGWQPVGEPVWIDGAEAARHFARDKIKAQ